MPQTDQRNFRTSGRPTSSVKIKVNEICEHALHARKRWSILTPKKKPEKEGDCSDEEKFNAKPTAVTLQAIPKWERFVTYVSAGTEVPREAVTLPELATSARRARDNDPWSQDE